jgi:hypothetical protein
MQNFGKIKNAFNGILADGVVSKSDTNKLLFKKYIQTIKESKILKAQFLVYNNIENKLENDTTSASVFVTENLKLLEKFKVSDIIKENQKLLAISKDIEGKLEEAYDTKLSSLHESISNLIFTKRTAKNMNEVTDNITNVINYIKANKLTEKVESIDLPFSLLSTMMVDKYNAKYATLDESDRQVLKVLIDSNDEQKKEVYSVTLRECIDLIDVKLKTSDLDGKERLLRVKDKLLNDKKDINEDFIKNISKLVELKSDLKNN